MNADSPFIYASLFFGPLPPWKIERVLLNVAGSTLSAFKTKLAILNMKKKHKTIERKKFSSENEYLGPTQDSPKTLFKVPAGYSHWLICQ